MTPLQSALLNLESGRADTGARSLGLRTARVTQAKNGKLYARGGDGGEYELEPLTNGAVAEGQVILVQVQGDRAYFHSMPSA